MKITVLPGDGVGPEVTRHALGVLETVSAAHGIEIETREALIGGIAIRATGSPLPQETIDAFDSADAVLL